MNCYKNRIIKFYEVSKRKIGDDGINTYTIDFDYRCIKMHRYTIFKRAKVKDYMCIVRYRTILSIDL